MTMRYEEPAGRDPLPFGPLTAAWLHMTAWGEEHPVGLILLVLALGFVAVTALALALPPILAALGDDQASTDVPADGPAATATPLGTAAGPAVSNSRMKREAGAERVAGEYEAPAFPRNEPLSGAAGRRSATGANLATRGNPAGPTGAVRAGAPASFAFPQASSLGPQACPESGLRFGWAVVVGILIIAWMLGPVARRNVHRRDR